MTLEQVLERFGNLDLLFSGYYKYQFTYNNEDPETSILVCLRIGGHPDEIYRLELGPMTTINEWIKSGGADTYISLWLGGKELFSFDV